MVDSGQNLGISQQLSSSLVKFQYFNVGTYLGRKEGHWSVRKKVQAGSYLQAFWTKL